MRGLLPLIYILVQNFRSDPPSILQYAFFAALLALFYFFLKLYSIRRSIRCLRQQGLPMPPRHPLWGHLPLVIGIVAKLPHDAHTHYLADHVRRLYPELQSGFYLDTWPFADPFLVLISPDFAAQVSKPENYLPRHPGIKKFITPITGGNDFGSMEGESWKMWRKIFNPGFSSGHITSLVPAMMETVLFFREILRKHAQNNEIFSLENAALNLTLDVIGKVALGADFDTQKGSNEMTTALRRQVRWCAFGSEPNAFATLWNPLRPFWIWCNTRKMDRYVNTELDKRYINSEGVQKSKTIIDLALNSYLEEKFSATQNNGMDNTFRLSAISQMKLFIFAGHDTTATTICYVFLLLSRNPQALKRLREEHDAVLGERNRTSDY